MIAVVLGRPISGGSALASAIVAMGYHPGLTIFGPCAPSFRPDWEDALLTPLLIAGARPDVDQWKEIMETRLEMASELGCAGTMMKSPMFCLAGEPFTQALSAFISKVFWVSRNHRDRQAALETYSSGARKTLMKIDAQIDDSLSELADRHIYYEDLLESPATTLEPVAEALGAEDRLAEAVAAIGPRRLSLCRG